MFEPNRAFRISTTGHSMKKFNDIQSDFTKIPNELLNDKDLSWKAKGLFCYMASKKDNYHFTVKSLATQFNDGRSAIFAAMDELKAKGWMIYTKKADGFGKYALLATLKPESDKRTLEQKPSHQPKSDKQIMDQEPKSDNPELGFRTMRKPVCITKTDSNTKTDIYKEALDKNKKIDQDHKQAIHLPLSAKKSVEELLTSINQGEI